MPGLIGTKIGMTRVVTSDGKMIPVTVIQCDPNTITQVKTDDTDGYKAVVVGAQPLAKPKKNKKYAVVREFRIEAPEEFEVGKQLDVTLFQSEDEEAHLTATITATSKGRGFAGVIKRHNFSRGPETHGSHHHREPGSIGACAMPGRVAKGKKLPGQMGNVQKTIKQVPVVLVDKSKNLVAVKGPVPGPINGIVKLTLEQ